MMKYEVLHDLCDKLAFKGVKSKLDEVLSRAEETGESVVSSLTELLNTEYELRCDRQLNYRIQRAHLPVNWILDSYPFEQQPGVNKQQIMTLAELSFMKEAKNIVFIGPPGTGKTGLTVGLMREALINGHRCRFYNAQDLLDELYASLADCSTPKLLEQLSRYEILAIDELGVLSLSDAQINALFKLMDMRYGRKSTIITSNLDYESWYELFRRKELADALLDRIKHRCVTIRINGPSLRAIESERVAEQEVQSKLKKSAKKR